MDRLVLAKQLEIDEQRRLTPYTDSRGNVTVGVGHLVLPTDEVRWGQTTTEAQCQAFLACDIDVAVQTCHAIWGPAWDTYPETVQEVTANMAFQLGQSRLETFALFIHAVQMRAWPRAAAQMRASLWAQQTGARAERLATRMAAVTEG